MDLKLQQAIVATRAGRTDVAQHLLAQLINEKPDNAHAWFLLGNIADSKERRVRYLQKAVALDPQNSVVKSQLENLTAPFVPTPVISREDLIEQVPASETELQPIIYDPAPVKKLAKTAAVIDEPKTPQKLPEWLQDLENKQLIPQETTGNKGTEWPVPDKNPKRESHEQVQKARVLHIPQSTTNNNSSSDRTKEEIWLLRILAVMVVIAAVVLGFLVLLILF